MLFCIADLHLCKNIWTHRKDIAGDSVQAFRDIAESIIEKISSCNHPLKRGKADLILAGDIFDKKTIDGFTLRHYDETIWLLKNAGVQVYFIQGNHDKNEIPLPNAAMNENVHHLGGLPTSNIDGKRILGLDWAPRAELIELMNSYTEDIDLLVLHTAFEHLLSFEGAYSLSIDDIPANFKNVFVGDIHITNISDLPNRGYIVSPGAIHACDIGQDKPKGYFDLSCLENPLFVEIDYRRIYREKIVKLQDIDVFKDRLNSTFKQRESKYEPIVEIQYNIKFADEITRITMQFPDYKYFLHGVREESVLLNEAVTYEQATLAGSLSEIMKEEDKDFEFMLSILSGEAEQQIETQLGGIGQ